VAVSWQGITNRQVTWVGNTPYAPLSPIPFIPSKVHESKYRSAWPAADDWLYYPLIHVPPYEYIWKEYILVREKRYTPEEPRFDQQPRRTIPILPVFVSPPLVQQQFGMLEVEVRQQTVQHTPIVPAFVPPVEHWQNPVQLQEPFWQVPAKVSIVFAHYRRLETTVIRLLESGVPRILEH
jgi:hypothetical protein